MPPHGGAPASPVPPTIADREAELAALQSAFDEYIASSRELEDELDAELTKMQEKLADCSAANAALAAQLESVHPQLSSLERSLASTKSELEKEREARRVAELAQDEAEGRAREAEGSLAALRLEHDDAMEGMAFKDEELEEMREELESEREERERLRMELEELKSEVEAATRRAERAEAALDEEARTARDEKDGMQPEATSEEQASSAAAALAKETGDVLAMATTVASPSAESEMRSGGREEADDDRSGPPTEAPSPSTARDDDASLDADLMSDDEDDDGFGHRPATDTIHTNNSGLTDGLTSTAPDDNEEYVKELEGELETVTEQLIAAETKAVDLEAALETARESAEAAEARASALEEVLAELRETMSTGASEEREAVQRLMDELTAVKMVADKRKEELDAATEELNLVHEEMRAAEEDLTGANEAMRDIEERHSAEMNRLENELEAALARAREARTEADSLASALRDAGAEEQSLRDELGHLNEALDHAKADRDAAVEEMQALRSAFDEAEKAREEGVGKIEEQIRRDLMETHKREVDELKEELEGLDVANAGLKRMVEELESSRRDSAADAKSSAAAAAAAVSALAAGTAAKSEETVRLEKELAMARRDLERQEKEAERLKADLECRVAKTSSDLVKAEAELEAARAQLASMTAKMEELESNRMKMRTPTLSERKLMERTLTVADESGVSKRLFEEVEDEEEDRSDSEGGDSASSPASIFHRTHARSRRRTRHSSHTRARSSSPSTIVRMERDLDREARRVKELKEQVEKLKDQNRMAEAKVAHLEKMLNSLQQAGAAAEGVALASVTRTSPRAPPTLSSFAPVTAAQYDLSDSRDDAEESSRSVEEVLATNDPGVIESEYRALSQRSQVLREKNSSLLQKVLSLQGNIQVCCRVRPMRSTEVEAGLRGVVEPLGETEVGCFDSRTKNWKSYNFDRVWGPESTQTGVFRDLEQLALSVVDGYNACIFAYGQTGSGKTFTMEGSPDGNQYGVSYRTIQKLFGLLRFREQMQKQANPDAPPFNFSLQVGMLEIYNDEVYDLLTPSLDGVKNSKKPSLDVRRGADGYIEVPGLTKENVKSIHDVMDLLNRGTQNRASAATNLNEHSSRSHMILNVSVSSGVEGQPGNNGNLYLVDLAGSERVRKSAVEGKELKEAGHINKSLSALGNVMEALDRKAKHVPYRDSKLTYLLQDSLGGNSRTMMIVTVNPTSESYDETQYALQFATRVRRIQLGSAQRNVSSKNLEETVKNLMAEMKLLAKAKERSEQQMLSLKRENKRVQERLQSASDARVKASDESRTLAVLQKSNAEITERWQKEKAQRDEQAADLENCQKELHRAQQQLQKSFRNMENLGKDLLSKEQAISDLTAKLRAAKQETIQVKQKAKKSLIVAPRVSSGNLTSKPNRSNGAHKRISVVTNPDAVDPPEGDPPETGVIMNGVTRGNTAAKENGATKENGVTKENGATKEDGAPTPTNSYVSETRAKVLALLLEHDPTKADRIDTLMERFKGRERFLLNKIVARYEGEGKSEEKQASKAKNDASPGSSAKVTAKKRSEMALARHKERMQNRNSAAGGAGSSLLQSKLNG